VPDENIVRFRAEAGLLRDLLARRAELDPELSLHEIARRDLATYYAALADERVAQARGALKRACRELDETVIAAARAVGCEATIAVTRDGVERRVRAGGPAGLRRSMALLVTHADLPATVPGEYDCLRGFYERVCGDTAHTPTLGETTHFLALARRLHEACEVYLGERPATLEELARQNAANYAQDRMTE